MAPVDGITGFLRCCASIHLDEAARVRLVTAAALVSDWTPLAERAESHGLAPLVRRHGRDCGVALPAGVSAQLALLALRNREFVQIQIEALRDIAGTLTAAGIEHVMLKGAVLAFDIYPAPELRPMRDLDILVAPKACSRVVALMAQLGFRRSADPAPWAHHHLPALARFSKGYKVTVEIHEDAMTYDRRERLSLSTTTAPLRVVPAGGQSLTAFGHIDMLRHLAAGLLERRQETRLISAVDLIGYAEHHVDQIDWEQLARRQPAVTNALRLMDYLRPLPSALEFLNPPRGTPPSGVGFGLPLLGRVALRHKADTVSVGALLYPSEWWMRAYYGIPESRGLTPTRWLCHAPRIVHWAVRRWAAGLRSRVARAGNRLRAPSRHGKIDSR